MRLGWTKNKNSTTYRAVKTIRVDGTNRTLAVKTFGSDKFICETYGVTDAKAWAREQVRMMGEEEKEDEPSLRSPSIPVPACRWIHSAASTAAISSCSRSITNSGWTGYVP